MRTMIVALALVAAALTLTGQPADCAWCAGTACTRADQCHGGCDACLIPPGEHWGTCVSLGR